MPTTPQSSRFIPSSQNSSNPKLLPVTSKLALQGVIDPDRFPVDKDSNAIKKRKRGVSSGYSDHAVSDVATQNQSHGSLKDIQAVPSTPPVFGKPLRHKETGSPLTPLSLDQPPSRKVNVSSPDDHWLPMIPLTSRKPPEKLEMVSPEDIKELLANCMGSPALKSKIDQNQLIEATSLDKVGVPGQGSPLPILSRNGLPYDVSPGHDNNAFKQFRRETKQPSLDQQFWPISECSQVLIDLAESEDDDLQFGVYKEFKNFSDLAQKRVPELKDWPDLDPTWVKQDIKKANPNSDQDPSHMQHVASIGEVHKNNCSSSRKIASDGVLAESFSMACALENYICLKKGSNSNLERTVSHHFSIIKPSAEDDLSKYDKSEISRSDQNAECHIVLPSMARPQCIIARGCRYFVVSTYFLRNRKLACRVQRLYPGAELIERDVALHEHSGSGFQRCPDPALKLIDNMCDEADITISPGTGIVLTTLQKIRQCSLPGQAVRMIVRERVARVAPRYERLLILVSEDNIRDYIANESGNVEPHIVDSDYKAVVEFIGFCSTLKQDTQALFIAGKEEQLAEWIVAMMVKHAGVDTGVKLISEETTWELFLRRAGFNSFAAQAILGELKGQSTAAEVGLTAFVKMSVEKRVERFEKMFGGTNLLKRVSSQLDARW